MQERLGAMQIYCAYARDAASQGRWKAAHGLFQRALFFERAENLAMPDEQASISGAWDELDCIARVVYPVDASGSGFSTQGATR